VHPKVVGRRGWALIRGLARANVTAGWTLAGGTGLALQLGHRLSYDLDFFATRRFDGVRLADALAGVAAVTVLGRSAGTLHVTLAGSRLSFLKLQRPLLFPGTPYRGIVVADPRDIAVMKVLAIGGRGSRKDFVDLHFFIRSGGSLESVFEWLRRRFRGIDFNEYHLLRSLSYFGDAETEPMPRMLRRASWAEIRRTIVAEVRRLS
jgi:hypothetical protein